MFGRLSYAIGRTAGSAAWAAFEIGDGIARRFVSGVLDGALGAPDVDAYVSRTQPRTAAPNHQSDL